MRLPGAGPRGSQAADLQALHEIRRIPTCYAVREAQLDYRSQSIGVLDFVAPLAIIRHEQVVEDGG